MMNRNINPHSTNEPYLVITEQPKQRGYRFRYDCEGGSHGNIYGENTSKNRKTYPTIQIQNFNGCATVSVTLVTDEKNPQQHTHELIGNDCKNGTCILETKPGKGNCTTVQFSGMSIKHCTRKRAQEILKERLLEDLRSERLKHGPTGGRVDLNSVAITEQDVRDADEKSKEMARTLDLSVVRLCFSATLKDPAGVYCRKLTPVLSAPVFDAKSPGAAALKICRMDKSSGCCTGNEEVFLLCDKVQKDDIAVWFQEINANGDVLWEDYGVFGPQDVHRQFAIVFRTPAYKSSKITSPVLVSVKLKRLTKSEESNEVPFTYCPQLDDSEAISRKRIKVLPNFDMTSGDSLLPVKPFGGDRISQNGGNNMFDGGGSGFHGGQMRLETAHAPAMNNQVTHEPKPPMTFPHASFPHAPFPRVPLSMNTQPVAPQQQMTGYTGSHVTAPDFTQTPACSVSYDPSFDIFLPGHAPDPLEDTKPPVPFVFHGQTFPDASAFVSRGINNSPTPGRVPSRRDAGAFPSSPSDQPQDLSLKKKIHTDSAAHEDSGFGSAEGSGLLGRQPPADPLVPLTVSELDDGQADQTEPAEYDQSRMDAVTAASKSDRVEGLLASSLVQFGDRLFKALQDFAATGDVGYLLLVQRRLLMQQDDNGDNIIHLAVIHKKLQVLRDLLKVIQTVKDTDAVNQINNLMQTPLHLAVLLRDAQIVDMLVHHGACVHAQDRNANTSLHLAVKGGAKLCLQNILKASSRPLAGTKRLHCPGINLLNSEGLAPIHLAVSQGQLDIIKLLLQLGGADVNLPDGKTGKTPVHYAVQEDELAILSYLAIEARADVNMENFAGATPLHMAVLEKRVGCVSILMASGSDPDAEMYETYGSEEDEGESLTAMGDSGDDLQPDEAVGQGAEDSDNEGLSLKERLKHQQEREEKEKEGDSEDSGREDSKERSKDSGRTRENVTRGVETRDNDCVREDPQLPKTVRLVTPRTLARGDQKLESILSGDECSEPMRAPGGFSLTNNMLNLDPRMFDVVSSTQQALSATERSGLIDSSFSCTLSDLDSMAKAQLARLLDPPKEGKDWRELAHRLDQSVLVSSLKAIASPTKALLDSYRALDGSLDRLQGELEKMGRTDAVTIIQTVRSMKHSVWKQHKQSIPISSHVTQLQGSLQSMTLMS